MKTRLTLLALAATAVSVFAQGTVDFRNTGVSFQTAVGAGEDRLVHNQDGSLLKGTNFLVQLYWSTDASLVGNNDKSLTGWTAVSHAPVTMRVTTTTAAGCWLTAAGDNMRTIWASGPGVLQIRVWDGGAGGATSFDNAALYGVSKGFAYSIPSPSDPPSAYLMENFRGFQLVPEPSIIGLGILGAIAGLFVFRRRN